jgi:hypothetical protein
VPRSGRRRRAREASAAIPTTLRITRGKQAGLTMALGDQLKIGRSADCQLILDDDYVSTQHARIYRSGDRLHRRRPGFDQRHLPQQRAAERADPIHARRHAADRADADHRGGLSSWR